MSAESLCYLGKRERERAEGIPWFPLAGYTVTTMLGQYIQFQLIPKFLCYMRKSSTPSPQTPFSPPLFLVLTNSNCCLLALYCVNQPLLLPNIKWKEEVCMSFTAYTKGLLFHRHTTLIFILAFSTHFIQQFKRIKVSIPYFSDCIIEYYFYQFNASLVINLNDLQLQKKTNFNLFLNNTKKGCRNKPVENGSI